IDARGTVPGLRCCWGLAGCAGSTPATPAPTTPPGVAGGVALRASPSKVDQKHYNLLPDMEIPFSQEAAAMILGPVLERFIQDAHMPLMFRALLERALDPAELDAMFEATAEKQYTRQLLFSAIVDLLAVVVFRMQPSVRRAYLSSSGMLASLTAVSEKLKGT